MKMTFFIYVRSQSTSVEVKPTPYHTLCWLGPPCATRTHKNTFSRLGLDEEHAKEVIKQSCPLIQTHVLDVLAYRR